MSQTAPPADTRESWMARIQGARDPAETERACRGAVEAFPTETSFHGRLADLLSEARRYDEAAAVLTSAMALCPKDPKHPVRMARIRTRQGQLLEAERFYLGALARAGARLDPSWRVELAGGLMRMRDFEAAVIQLEQAEDEPPARAMLRQAVQRRNTQRRAGITVDTVRQLAEAEDLLRRKRPAQAEPAFREALRRAPACIDAWTGLIGALSAQGRAEEAQAVTEDWAAAALAPAPVVRAATARPVSWRGLRFDPRTPLPLRRKEDVLTQVATPQALLQADNAYFVVDPGGAPIRHDPIIPLEPDGGPAFLVETRTAPSGVMALTSAALAGRGAVITAAGEVLADSLLLDRAFKFQGDIVGQRFQFEASAFADGACRIDHFEEPAFLMTGPTDQNYGDWFWNFGPRLHLYRAAGLNVPILVSADIGERYIQILEAMGVPRERLRFHDPQAVSIFPKLYVPSWPGADRLSPMADWYAAFEPAKIRTGRGPRERLFLSRRNIAKRALANEGEARDLFESRGFRVICPEELSIAETLQTFARPAFVAAPYGSAMRNLAFCHEKPVGLFLLPPDEEPFIRGSALWLAEAGVRFGYVIGKVLQANAHETSRRAPWAIDLGRVERALDRMLALFPDG